MHKNQVKILQINHVTHNVLQIVTEKLQNFVYVPGQATEVSINKDGWENKGRPFTFTSIPDNDYLEFTIKTYPEHKGVTNELLSLKIGDELILQDIFGEIAYKGEGVFIAGGAGITPFISIFRDLESKKQIGNNKLIFANKSKMDIIHEKEFIKILGKKFINILSDDQSGEYAHGFISENFLKENIEDFNTFFYLCGPPPMMNAVENILVILNVDEELIIKEEF